MTTRSKLKTGRRRCIKQLDNGQRCPNDALKDSNYCGVHQQDLGASRRHIRKK
jgi:hypothetical protein